MLLLLAACTPAEDVAPAASAVDCTAAPAVDWDNWGHGFFLTACNSCHSVATPDRRGAPAGVDFDAWEQVSSRSDNIWDRVLVNGDMPVGGGVYPDDLQLLAVLLACSR